MHSLEAGQHRREYWVNTCIMSIKDEMNKNSRENFALYHLMEMLEYIQGIFVYISHHVHQLGCISSIGKIIL